MNDPWIFAGEPRVKNRAGGSITLVEGASFSISSSSGDIEPSGAQGVFFQDTRFVSTWRVRLDGEELQNLAVIAGHPFAATFVSRSQPRPGQPDSTILVERSRYVGNGMREDIIIHNLGREPATCAIAFELDADFAHLFEVKENRVRKHGHRSVEVTGTDDELRLRVRRGDASPRRGVPARRSRSRPHLATLDVTIPTDGEWRISLEFSLTLDGDPVALRYSGDDPVGHSVPVARLRAWEETTPRIRTEHHDFDATFLQSQQDLAALQISDPEHPDRTVIAAGAPWFMTLFGRDSLITSLMTLGVDPSLATSTLLTLARLQGVRVDAASEEQPGKILHEMRRGLTTVADTPAGSIYYGSIDATPLFVVLLGELHRWGAPDDMVNQLLPHADRALAWIEEFGDRDGDGFVEYQRATDRGLANQGWKDSFDGVNFADGTLAEPPIALCEVQGYVYAAYIARAEIARHRGDEKTAADYENRATRLKSAFNEQFWLEARGLLRAGSRRSEASDRLADLQHRALPVVRHHRRGQGRPDGRAALRSRDVHRMGHPDPGHLDGPLQPGELSQRLGMAARQRDLRRRARPLRIPQAGRGGDGRAVRSGRRLRRPPARVVLRVRPRQRSRSRSPTRPPVRRRPGHLPPPSGCCARRSCAWSPRIPDGLVACLPCIPKAFGSLSVENLFLAGTRLAIEASGAVAQVHGLPEHWRLVTNADGALAAATDSPAAP